MCPHVKTPHMTEKRPKHTFHLKRSLVSAAAVSQHACFYGFYAPFLSPCLLHHWAMRFSSQWNLILLLYAQECFSPGEWQGQFTFFWLFLKSIRLRLRRVLTVSFIKEHKHIPHVVQKTPFFLRSVSESSLCHRLLWLLLKQMFSKRAHSPSVCCKQRWPPTRRYSYERECRIGIQWIIRSQLVFLSPL